MLEAENAKRFAINIAYSKIENEGITDLEECKKVFEDSFLKVSEIFEEATGKNLFNYIKGEEYYENNFSNYISTDYIKE